MARFQCSVSTPIRKGLDWHQRWEGEDDGLIACWEAGREFANFHADEAELARGGQLVMLPWKGGVESRIKGPKVGSLYYLAMWRGLRGDDLDLALDEEPCVTCSKTGQLVRFSHDNRKLTPT